MTACEGASVMVEGLVKKLVGAGFEIASSAEGSAGMLGSA